ncbi:hypothetical protein [Streptomyces sp. NPDC088719]|uniref:hypothetical protein n=1 Tax=Streptomyces sp. NPDC088719 TaxID=3365872 RepID=UPI003808A362
MTPSPAPARPNASRVRCAPATLVLAVLTVLTVLTVVGGAAPATGAAPAPISRSLAAAVTAAAPAPAAPRTHGVGHHTEHDFRHRAGHDFRRHAGYDTRHEAGHEARYGAGRTSGSDLGAPGHTSGAVAVSGTGAVAQAGHEQPRAAADPAQAPRAGSGRAYLLLHAPPPPHDALTPAVPGPVEPRAGVQHAAADSFDAPGSRRGELPGVRGPPGRTTGPTTGHPSCSAEPAPRPH